MSDYRIDSRDGKHVLLYRTFTVLGRFNMLTEALDAKVLHEVGF